MSVKTSLTPMGILFDSYQWEKKLVPRQIKSFLEMCTMIFKHYDKGIAGSFRSVFFF